MEQEPEYRPFEYSCPDCGHKYIEHGSVKKHPDHQVCPKCGNKKEGE